MQSGGAIVIGIGTSKLSRQHMGAKNVYPKQLLWEGLMGKYFAILGILVMLFVLGGCGVSHDVSQYGTPTPAKTLPPAVTQGAPTPTSAQDGASPSAPTKGSPTQGTPTPDPDEVSSSSPSDGMLVKCDNASKPRICYFVTDEEEVREALIREGSGAYTGVTFYFIFDPSISFFGGEGESDCALSSIDQRILHEMGNLLMETSIMYMRQLEKMGKSVQVKWGWLDKEEKENEDGKVDFLNDSFLEYPSDIQSKWWRGMQHRMGHGEGISGWESYKSFFDYFVNEAHGESSRLHIVILFTDGWMAGDSNKNTDDLERVWDKAREQSNLKIYPFIFAHCMKYSTQEPNTMDFWRANGSLFVSAGDDWKWRSSFVDNVTKIYPGLVPVELTMDNIGEHELLAPQNRENEIFIFRSNAGEKVKIQADFQMDTSVIPERHNVEIGGLDTGLWGVSQPSEAYSVCKAKRWHITYHKDDPEALYFIWEWASLPKGERWIERMRMQLTKHGTDVPPVQIKYGGKNTDDDEYLMWNPQYEWDITWRKDHYHLSPFEAPYQGCYDVYLHVSPVLSGNEGGGMTPFHVSPFKLEGSDFQDILPFGRSELSICVREKFGSSPQTFCFKVKSVFRRLDDAIDWQHATVKYDDKGADEGKHLHVEVPWRSGGWLPLPYSGVKFSGTLRAEFASEGPERFYRDNNSQLEIGKTLCDVRNAEVDTKPHSAIVTFSNIVWSGKGLKFESPLWPSACFRFLRKVDVTIKVDGNETGDIWKSAESTWECSSTGCELP